MVVFEGSICESLRVNRACPYGLQRERERGMRERRRFSDFLHVYPCPHWVLPLKTCSNWSKTKLT